jgi:hypothetical protein
MEGDWEARIFAIAGAFKYALPHDYLHSHRRCGTCQPRRSDMYPRDKASVFAPKVQGWSAQGNALVLPHKSSGWY